MTNLSGYSKKLAVPAGFDAPRLLRYNHVTARAMPRDDLGATRQKEQPSRYQDAPCAVAFEDRAARHCCGDRLAGMDNRDRRGATARSGLE
jgi:hypothetical protein